MTSGTETSTAGRRSPRRRRRWWIGGAVLLIVVVAVATALKLPGYYRSRGDAARTVDGRASRDVDELLESVDAYEKAIALAPRDPVARISLARSLILLRPRRSRSVEHLDRAARLLREAYALKPRDVTLYHDLGKALRDLCEASAGDPRFCGAGEEILRDAQAAVPATAEGSIAVIRAREYLGRIYAAQGKHDEAERVLRDAAAALEAAPAKSDAAGYYGCPYQALGELYAKLHQEDRVAREYMRAADLEPDKKVAPYEAARECFLAGDYANAEKYVDRSLSVTSSQSDMKNAGAKPDVLKGYLDVLARRYDAAKARFDAVLARDPRDYGARVGLAHLAVVRKDYAAARDHARPALALDPEHERDAALPPETRGALLGRDRLLVYELACLALAWCAANENRHEEAIALYDRILARRPDHVLALLGKGNSLSGLKRLDEAEALFARVLKRDPTNQYALAELGLIRYNRGDDRGAEESFRAALAQDQQTYTCPYEGLGLVYLRQGKVDQARESFEKSIAINPNIEYKKYNGLAKIYIREGKIAEARKLLAKSIENYPYDPEAKDLLARLDAKP